MVFLEKRRVQGDDDDDDVSNCKLHIYTFSVSLASIF